MKQKKNRQEKLSVLLRFIRRWLGEWVAEYVFRNQMELWGEQMEQLLTGALDSQNERGAVSSLLELLPEEFTTAELIKLRARNGQSVKSESIRKLLQRWRNNGRIDKKAENQWTKLHE